MCFDDNFNKPLEPALLHSGHDTASERLRRWTRNPLGSARRGSNPLGVDFFDASHAQDAIRASWNCLSLADLRVNHANTRTNEISAKLGDSALRENADCAGQTTTGF